MKAVFALLVWCFIFKLYGSADPVIYSKVLNQVITTSFYTSEIVVGKKLSLKDIRVKVNFEHGSTAEIDLILYAPDGESVQIYRDDGTRKKAIKNWFGYGEDDKTPTVSLFGFKGVSMEGNWKLEIKNNSGDPLKLMDWAIEVLGVVQNDIMIRPLHSYYKTKILPGENFNLNYRLGKNYGFTEPLPKSTVIKIETDHPCINQDELNTQAYLIEGHGSNEFNYNLSLLKGCPEGSIISLDVMLFDPVNGSLLQYLKDRIIVGMPFANYYQELLDDQSSYQGIKSDITINDDGFISDISVYVNVMHAYKGDLKIRLISPEGRVIRFHNKKGGAKDDIVGWYRAYNKGLKSHRPLVSLVGSKAQGTWRLHLVDVQGLDIGLFQGWALNIKTVPVKELDISLLDIRNEANEVVNRLEPSGAYTFRYELSNFSTQDLKNFKFLMRTNRDCVIKDNAFNPPQLFDVLEANSSVIVEKVFNLRPCDREYITLRYAAYTIDPRYYNYKTGYERFYLTNKKVIKNSLFVCIF